MTTLTITIPDSITPRVINDLTKRWGYSPTLEDGSPNPETKAQFVKRKIVEYLKRECKAQEVEDAANTAAGTAGTSADTDIQLT